MHKISQFRAVMGSFLCCHRNKQVFNILIDNFCMIISFIMECTIFKKIRGKLNIRPGKRFWGGLKKYIYFPLRICLNTSYQMMLRPFWIVLLVFKDYRFGMDIKEKIYAPYQCVMYFTSTSSTLETYIICHFLVIINTHKNIS